MEVNSKAYWDHRFHTDWIGNHGKQQSAFFATLALGAFPPWLNSDIQQKNLTICDWGCALGDGTHVLEQAFPASTLAGIDFSEVAIAGAREAYPNIGFLSTNLLDQEHSTHYDVIFSSNTLEHFSEPWKTLLHISRYANRHLVILIPYKEYRRYSEHLYSFDENTIPSGIGSSFPLTHMQIIDGSSFSPSFWGDLQVLLVYSHTGTVSELGLKTMDDSGIRATEGLYRQKLILQELKETREKLAEQLSLSGAKAAQEAEEHRKILAEKEEVIRHQRHLLEIRQLMNIKSLMEDQLAGKDVVIAGLKKEIEGASLHITSLEERMTADDGQIKGLSAKLDEAKLELDDQLAEKDRVIEELREELEKEQRRLASEIGEAAKYEAETRRLEQEVEHWKTQAGQKQELEERLEEMEAALEKLKEEKESIILDLNSEKDRAIEDLDIKLEAALRGQESARQALAKETAGREQHVARLQKELAAMQSQTSREIQSLNEQERQSAAQKKRLEEEKEKLEEEKRKLHDDKRKLEQERRSLEQELAAGNELSAGLRTRLREVEKGAGEARAALEAKLAENEASLLVLQNELEQRKQSQTEMYRSISDLQSHINKLQKDLEWYRSTFEDRSVWGVLKEKLRKPPGK